MLMGDIEVPVFVNIKSAWTLNTTVVPNGGGRPLYPTSGDVYSFEFRSGKGGFSQPMYIIQVPYSEPYMKLADDFFSNPNQ